MEKGDDAWQRQEDLLIRRNDRWRLAAQPSKRLGYQGVQFRDKYEGYFVKGEREGFGKYEWVGGDSHEGTWCQGLMHGKGVYLSAGGSLHGTWVNGKLSGAGVHRFRCGSVFTGEYKAGERHGVGTLIFASGEVYEGDWYKDVIHGYGSWSSPDGRRFIGTWAHGFPSGRAFSVASTMRTRRMMMKEARPSGKPDPV